MYECRFTTTWTGGYETIELTWCSSERDITYIYRFKKED